MLPIITIAVLLIAAPCTAAPTPAPTSCPASSVAAEYPPPTMPPTPSPTPPPTTPPTPSSSLQVPSFAPTTPAPMPKPTTAPTHQSSNLRAMAPSSSSADSATSAPALKPTAQQLESRSPALKQLVDTGFAAAEICLDLDHERAEAMKEMVMAILLFGLAAGMVWTQWGILRAICSWVLSFCARAPVANVDAGAGGAGGGLADDDIPMAMPV